MVRIAIKPMERDDLEVVSQLEQTLYDFPWSFRNFQDSMESGYRCMCLWLDQEIAGYVILMRAVDESHLLNISIGKHWQGQGWGKYLLDWSVSDARTSGSVGFLLEVRPSNHVAKHIYEKSGFKLIGVRKHYYPAISGREDAIVMFKQLERAL